MRRENSTFNMSFISQPGTYTLHNNDYFGCSELEDFACYVVADGMRSGNDKHEDPSARLAVEAIIAAFNESPSIGSRAVSRYLEIAHHALRENGGKKRCRASVVLVVTNYQKLRYGFAGNSRFHLYRSGKLFLESGDHSLSWEMMEEGHLPKDKIAAHAERNNLQTYCGTMKAFHPTVSKKIKLKNSDIFSLFTRGIWENVDSNDMLSAVQMGENDPGEAVNCLEHLILDDAPTESQIENYTVCFVFIDKVFIDPQKKKRIKRIVILLITIILLIAMVIFLLAMWQKRRENWRTDMQIAYHNGIEYIHGHNFVRAREEMDTAYKLAEKLKDKKHKMDINSYKLLVESVIYADDLLSAKNYDEAIDAYGDAAKQSRYANNLAVDYIQKYRDKAAGYSEVQEYLFLGYGLADIKDWDNAERKYLEARRVASRLYDTDGKKEANDALQALYQAKEDDLRQQQEQAQEEVAAAEWIIDGDKALRDGDLVAAAVFYHLARDKYEEIGSNTIVASIDQKIELLGLKEQQNTSKAEHAANYLAEGDIMAKQGEYINAKRFYLLAREIYANLGYTEKLKEVQSKMDLADLYLANETSGNPIRRRDND